MEVKRIGILGLGSLGRAVAQLATGTGAEVLGWSRRPRSRQRGPRFEGDLELPEEVELVGTPAEVVERARVVFFALPAFAFGEVIEQIGEAARADHCFVHGTKGLAADGQLMNELIRGRTCVRQIGVLGGPVIAKDLARRGPDGLVMASRFDRVNAALSALLFGNGRRLSCSHDVVGVQVAGALRNVISVAAGMTGEMGEATRSAILARGLIETARLGVALGAASATFVGMAGVGDLIARRESATSRNYRVGERIARGDKPADVLGRLASPLEGAVTAKAAVKRAASLGVGMPLTQGVAAVLDGVVSTEHMLKQVLASDPGLGAGDSLV